MEQPVKSLYNGINISTIPEAIKKVFFKLGYRMGSFDIEPFTFKHSYDGIEFFILERNLKLIEYFIDEKKLVDEDNNILTRETLIPFLKEYGRGFYKSYTEYETSLKPENSVFVIENNQTAHKIFSRIHRSGLIGKSGQIPISFVIKKKLDELENIYNSKDFHCLLKDQCYKSGFEGGEFYKAWEIILHNPTLFEGIFVDKLEKSAPKEETIIATPDLSLKNIPNFNLQQRYYLFTKLNLDKSIHKIDTEKQTSKHKVLALIIGVSLDNAKHLLNGTYKKLMPEQKAEVDEYLLLQKIKL